MRVPLFPIIRISLFQFSAAYIDNLIEELAGILLTDDFPPTSFAMNFSNYIFGITVVYWA
tara:strand:+ start:1369 stop:1548 length:180 start_codon:yes stop_codon:yes gene_type:complete